MNDGHFNTIVQAASYLLQHAPEAEDTGTYLNKRLTPEIQSQFHFGYIPPAAHWRLLTDLVPEKVLEQTGLVYSREFQDTQSVRSTRVCYFEHQPLIMPYRDVYGHILALVGRSLLSDTERQIEGIAKYRNTAFVKGNHLFGLDQAKDAIMQAGFVYVVEGQFDVIKAFEQGLQNVVAVGSSDLSARQLAILCRYTNDIRLLLDNDEAGKKGRERAISKYSQYAQVRNAYLPEGFKDLDEYLKQTEVTNDLTLRMD